MADLLVRDRQSRFRESGSRFDPCNVRQIIGEGQGFRSGHRRPATVPRKTFRYFRFLCVQGMHAITAGHGMHDSHDMQSGYGMYGGHGMDDIYGTEGVYVGYGMGGIDAMDGSNSPSGINGVSGM